MCLVLRKQEGRCRREFNFYFLRGGLGRRGAENGAKTIVNELNKSCPTVVVKSGEE
jgi:hypothetical protein